MAKNTRNYLEKEIKVFEGEIEGLDPDKDQKKINKYKKTIGEFKQKIEDMDKAPKKKKSDKINVHDLVLANLDKGTYKDIGKVKEIKGEKAICGKINGNSFTIEIKSIKKSEVHSGIKRHYV